MIENAIILVAGLGNRLLPLTEATPKCLAPVNGTPILFNALDNFVAAGVKKVTLVVGHLSEVFHDRIGSSYLSMKISYIENPDYATTNSMYSLWLALRECGTDTWVLEGDVFFERSILDLDTGEDFQWYADSQANHMNGAFMVGDDKGHVTKLEIIREKKGLRPQGYYKSIGLLKLKKTAVSVLRDWLDTGVKEQKTDIYYDLIVKEHIGEFPVRLVDVARSKWYEIDDREDLKIAEEIFS